MSEFQWDLTELIAEYPKGNDTILVHKHLLNDKKYISIRVYYTDKTTNELRPTKKGITIQDEIMKDILYKLTDALWE